MDKEINSQKKPRPFLAGALHLECFFGVSDCNPNGLHHAAHTTHTTHATHVGHTAGWGTTFFGFVGDHALSGEEQSGYGTSIL
jgi:hypothetical protein